MYCQVSAKSDFLNFSQFFTFHFFSLFLILKHFLVVFFNISVNGAMIHEVRYRVG